jgi:purine-binding chemotaxis protein CheW
MTMQNHTNSVYLIFELQDTLYGIEVLSVREIVELPELTPAAQAPAYIVGMLNWRGKIAPVMDLSQRLGQRTHEYQLGDKVIVLEHAGILMGLVVSQVHDTCEISRAQIEHVPAYGIGEEATARFIGGVAKRDQDLVMLLDLETLMRLPEQASHPAEFAGPPEFSLSMNAEGKQILRARAASLMQTDQSQDLTGQVPLAVVKLNDEFYGVDLSLVREFADRPEVTPIPCCPHHIVGLINLRGDLLTLIDIRSSINLSKNHRKTQEKVIVIEIQGLAASTEGSGRLGILVDEVVDIVYLGPTEIHPVPTSTKAARSECLRGIGPYGTKMLSILDLRCLLKEETLVVNEQV